ncbi:pilus assembly protein PilP [Legionella dresdenensis]|uniref:Pilus assembly protein PilP n=1 Tax=Legionella dresdenensis TaxID=450200 RepID=A0ABV8CDW3_9GAMM
MIANNQLKKLLSLIILTACLSACVSEADLELSRYINEIKQRKARPIEPIPEFLPLPKFSYPENDNRRSPFKQKEKKKAADQQAPNTKRPKQPLEMFPLDSLKFVGVLKQGAMIWALVSQPGGEVVRVRPGEYMGQNYGKIIQIKDTVIKLEESVQAEGKWQKRITTININTGQ